MHRRISGQAQSCMESLMKTLQKLADDALFIQDACNLRAVVRGMVRAMDDLREIMPTNDCWMYHPIIRLWADKIASMTGIQDGEWDSCSAFRTVEELAAHKQEESTCHA